MFELARDAEFVTNLPRNKKAFIISAISVARNNRTAARVISLGDLDGLIVHYFPKNVGEDTVMVEYYDEATPSIKVSELIELLKS